MNAPDTRYEERYKRRVIENLQRRARGLGFTLVEIPRWVEFLRKVGALLGWPIHTPDPDERP
jgi:hypothetical protein